MSRPTAISMMVMRFFISLFLFYAIRLLNRGALLNFGIGACRGLRVAIPPTAAKRLEQCRRIGIARRLRGNEVEPFLLKLLLGDQQGDDAAAAELILTRREIQGLAGERGCIGLRLERASIRRHGTAAVAGPRRCSIRPDLRTGCAIAATGGRCSR